MQARRISVNKRPAQPQVTHHHQPFKALRSCAVVMAFDFFIPLVPRSSITMYFLALNSHISRLLRYVSTYNRVFHCISCLVVSGSLVLCYLVVSFTHF